MILLFGFILIVVGCCLTSSAEDDRAYESRQERRHTELMSAIKNDRVSSVNKTKVTRRRIVKDKEGNTIAEEIIEEVE